MVGHVATKDSGLEFHVGFLKKEIHLGLRNCFCSRKDFFFNSNKKQKFYVNRTGHRAIKDSCINSNIVTESQGT